MTAAAAASPAHIFDADREAQWRQHMIDIIDPAWRPDEYDHAPRRAHAEDLAQHAPNTGQGAPVIPLGGDRP